MANCKLESGSEIVRGPLPTSIGNLGAGGLTASMGEYSPIKPVRLRKTLTNFDAGAVNFKLFALELL